MIHRQLFLALVATLACHQTIFAQQIVPDSSGKQWQETNRWTSKKPVTETRIEQRPYTVYTERCSTEYHPSYRNVYTPVTEYVWEPYMANRWNPFTQPTVAYRYVPHTRWDVRTEETQIPVARRELIPEQRVANVAVVTQKLVDEEHITRVAVSGSDPFAGTATAAKPIGSTGTLSSDPPKLGSTWK